MVTVRTIDIVEAIVVGVCVRLPCVIGKGILDIGIFGCSKAVTWIKDTCLYCYDKAKEVAKKHFCNESPLSSPKTSPPLSKRISTEADEIDVAIRFPLLDDTQKLDL